jgi:hypothetical protein
VLQDSQVRNLKFRCKPRTLFPSRPARALVAVCSLGFFAGVLDLPAQAAAWVDSPFSIPLSSDDLQLSTPRLVVGNATTSVGGGGFDLNASLGAGRYYNNAISITGQNTTTVNLEAGHLWNGHETLQHVNQFIHSSDTWGGTAVSPKFDRHATWAAMLIGGRETPVNPALRQTGIAPGTNLVSAAIATNWSGNAYALDFGISINSYLTAYGTSYTVADVINSSYGYADPGAVDLLSLYTDAMAFQNSQTLHVASAGNSGPFSNSVSAPGAGYNALAVGALGNANSFDDVAAFSSRGPQVFEYYNELNQIVSVQGVRASVDISAPGTSLTSAFYGGQTGGNNPLLLGSVNGGSDPAEYSTGIGGTSFAAPLVAGGAALVLSAAKTLPGLSTNPEATESVVVKALLLNGADKTAGWDNGLQETTVDGNTFLRTTRSLDWEVGAGAMNLDATFEMQVNGQQGVTGTAPGFQGSVQNKGWDFGSSLIGETNDYRLERQLLGGSTLNATLAWMRIREFDELEGLLFEVAQANLNLSVWALDESYSFASLVASSESIYNNVEHLSFLLPQNGYYGIRVTYLANVFDNTSGSIWGTSGFAQEYGLAWSATAVPEPGSAFLLLISFGGFLVLRLRKRGSSLQIRHLIRPGQR